LGERAGRNPSEGDSRQQSAHNSSADCYGEDEDDYATGHLRGPKDLKLQWRRRTQPYDAEPGQDSGHSCGAKRESGNVYDDKSQQIATRGPERASRYELAAAVKLPREEQVRGRSDTDEQD
jgi:hypothetical protein